MIADGLLGVKVTCLDQVDALIGRIHHLIVFEIAADIGICPGMHGGGHIIGTAAAQNGNAVNRSVRIGHRKGGHMQRQLDLLGKCFQRHGIFQLAHTPDGHGIRAERFGIAQT